MGTGVGTVVLTTKIPPYKDTPLNEEIILNYKFLYIPRMSLQILYNTVTQSPFTLNFSEFYSIQLR